MGKHKHRRRDTESEKTRKMKGSTKAIKDIKVIKRAGRETKKLDKTGNDQQVATVALACISINVYRIYNMIKFT